MNKFHEFVSTLKELYKNYPANIIPKCKQQPDISIIIPAFNKYEYSFLCIKSIITTILEEINYEIILVDDCSTDMTSQIEKYFTNLRIVRKNSNSGFIASCNDGAAAALGRYLIFLNNDTLVLKGWASSLLGCMEEDRSIAIAGSLIYNSDGSIQEAGGYIHNDSSSFLYSYDQSNTWYYNFLKEVDYVSGASLIIRKNFFDSCGGFDPIFGYGYFEDSNLAMNARKQGYRVVLQPDSALIHFNHITFSESHNELLKNNQKIFNTIWSSELNRNHLPQIDYKERHKLLSNSCRLPSEKAASRREKGQYNILFYSPFPLNKDKINTDENFYHFAARMKKFGHNVFFAHPATKTCCKEKYTWDNKNLWSKEITLSNEFKMYCSYTPGLDEYHHEELGQELMKICSELEIDMFVNCEIFHSKIMEYIQNYILKVFIPKEQRAFFGNRLYDNGIQHVDFSCNFADERAYLERGDLILATDDYMEDYCRKILEIDKVKLMKTGFPSECDICVHSGSNGKNILYVILHQSESGYASARDFIFALDSWLARKDCPFEINFSFMEDSLPESMLVLLSRPYIRLASSVDKIEGNIVVCPDTLGNESSLPGIRALSTGLPFFCTSFGSRAFASTLPEHNYPASNLKEMISDIVGIFADSERLVQLSEAGKKIFTSYQKEVDMSLLRLFEHTKFKQKPNLFNKDK